MDIKQEIAQAQKELEAIKANLKAAGADVHKREQMEGKQRWLEAKVEKLRRKQAN